jgi:hypothetical protein
MSGRGFFLRLGKQGHFALVGAEYSAEEGTMQIVTLQAIAEHPWNAVELDLPERASDELVIETCHAAKYCSLLELRLALLARKGLYASNRSKRREGDLDAEAYHNDRSQKAMHRLDFLLNNYPSVFAFVN